MLLLLAFGIRGAVEGALRLAPIAVLVERDAVAEVFGAIGTGKLAELPLVSAGGGGVALLKTDSLLRTK
jgi:hypothetical protein